MRMLRMLRVKMSFFKAPEAHVIAHRWGFFLNSMCNSLADESEWRSLN